MLCKKQVILPFRGALLPKFPNGEILLKSWPILSKFSNGVILFKFLLISSKPLLTLSITWLMYIFVFFLSYITCCILFYLVEIFSCFFVCVDDLLIYDNNNIYMYMSVYQFILLFIYTWYYIFICNFFLPWQTDE